MSSDGQPGSSTPWRRDPQRVEAGLESWARALRGDTVALSDVRAPDSGFANDTVLFRLDGEPLVARLSPAPEAPYPTFPTYDLELQRGVIDLVRRRTDVPVPEVVHVEHDESWLGVPFMVVRAVEGQVASDNPPYLLDPNGWFLQGSPDDWQRLERSTIDVLVRLHRLPDDDDAAFLRLDAPGGTALARQLEHQRRYYEWAREGRTIPLLEEAYEALVATLPGNERSVVGWGDSRPGNIIYRDFEPAAVLDWEMAWVGPPEVDVAWVTFFQQFFGGMASQYGLPPVPAMFGSKETVAIYEELGGQPLDDLTWYEAFGGFRMGIILLRMSLRSIAFGQQAPPDDPDDLIVFAPLLRQLLARMQG